MDIKKILSDANGGTIVFYDNNGKIRLSKFFNPMTAKQAVVKLKRQFSPSAQSANTDKASEEDDTNDIITMAHRRPGRPPRKDSAK